MLRQCAWCKAYSAGGQWVRPGTGDGIEEAAWRTLEQLARVHAVTHGICEKCAGDITPPRAPAGGAAAPGDSDVPEDTRPQVGRHRPVSPPCQEAPAVEPGIFPPSSEGRDHPPAPRFLRGNCK